MKGPGLRIDLDVRRVWRCSKCGRTVRTAGQVVAQRCGCSEVSQWMALVPAARREPFCPPRREPLPETETADEGPLTPPPIVDVTVVVDVIVVDQSAVGPLVDAAQPASGLTLEATASPVTDQAAAEPAVVQPVPANPQPDEFGAGLGDTSPDSRHP